MRPMKHRANASTTTTNLPKPFPAPSTLRGGQGRGKPINANKPNKHHMRAHVPTTNHNRRSIKIVSPTGVS